MSVLKGIKQHLGAEEGDGQAAWIAVAFVVALVLGCLWAARP